MNEFLIMETKGIKSLEDIKKLSVRYLNALKQSSVKTENNSLPYYERGCVITNMLKLCILALDQNAEKNASINVSLILEHVLELFPSDEFELLDIIQEFSAES
ncbi:hypothetical protein [Flavobacterium gelatinilyticum]|uniref:hypothetical protein n=1 Tax=Flavobacterium gelatinilyticum TaxID=3003260 RepID=UPI002480CE71|nr:hypothetical protein [Flavobacterium gelatinilyticum]